MRRGEYVLSGPLVLMVVGEETPFEEIEIA
jgi:hypothetical protein